VPDFVKRRFLWGLRSDLIYPQLGIKLRLSGFTYKNYGWDYLHLTPRLGLEIGKRYSGYFFVEYNLLTELGSGNKNYKFESTLSFILGARVGLF
jgi:hypothetical protein